MNIGPVNIGNPGSLLLALALGTALGVGYVWLDQRAPDPLAMADALVEDCEPTPGPCTAELAGGRITLGMATAIRELDSFPLTVELEGFEAVEGVAARFDMAAMDMGLNRYRLSEAPDGRWQGEAMLPVCTVDRSDWWVTVAVAHAGGTHRAAFLFHTVD